LVFQLHFPIFGNISIFSFDFVLNFHGALNRIYHTDKLCKNRS